MMKIKLPRGIKYKIEKPKPGIVIPGSDNEPILTVFGRGAKIQYRLVSCALGQECVISDTYWANNLSNQEIDAIDSWVACLIPSLLQEAGVRHFIRFMPDSKCYYDFNSQTLYGAEGYKEKKGKRDGNRENTIFINGEPCKLTKSEISFIDLLTRTPRAQFQREEVEDISGLHGPRSINQTWSRFRKYDPSIEATFLRRNGMFIYQGAPQCWVVGEETKGINLTMEKIFSVVGYGDIVATLDKNSRQLGVCLVSDIVPENMADFLGLKKELLDRASIDIDRLSK